jgi:hypothetical protein
MTDDQLPHSDDTESARGGIIATHPAQAGTFIVYASKQEVLERNPVILWGVEEHGRAVPITMNGPWDDIADAHSFVLHPTGDCSRYERSWANLDQAVADLLLTDS